MKCSPFILTVPSAWAIALVACGGSTPPAKTPTDETVAAAEAHDDDKGPPRDKAAPAPSGDPDATGSKPSSPCSGAEIHDLAAVLAQASCEARDAKPDAKRDIADALEVKVAIDARKAAPGSKATVTVSYRNKTDKELPLLFVVDPEPHFDLEVYTRKGARADAPAGAEPPLPADVAPAADKQVARVTLAAKGTAYLTLPWEVVRHKWAPKGALKGAVAGHGYPQVAAGPLPNGKYVLRVVTPMVGINEGIDHEITQPRVDVEVGKP